MGSIPEAVDQAVNTILEKHGFDNEGLNKWFKEEYEVTEFVLELKNAITEMIRFAMKK